MIGMKICNVKIGIHCEPETLSRQIFEQYQVYIEDIEPDYFIKITGITPEHTNVPGGANLGTIDVVFTQGCYVVSTPIYEGKIDPISHTAYLFLRSKNQILDIEFFIKMVVSYGLYELGGFLLHSAGIVRNNKAFLFFGKSGSGKSTVSKLSVNDIILSDEIVGLTYSGDKAVAHSTPFWNPGWSRRIQFVAEIGGIFRLVQDTRVFIEPIRPSLAVAEILASIPALPTNPDMCIGFIPMIEAMISRVGIHFLHFRKDNDFWDVIGRAT